MVLRERRLHECTLTTESGNVSLRFGCTIRMFGRSCNAPFNGAWAGSPTLICPVTDAPTVCLQSQCTFNGAWGGSKVPAVFYISSYFWDRAQDVGLIPDNKVGICYESPCTPRFPSPFRGFSSVVRPAELMLQQTAREAAVMV